MPHWPFKVVIYNVRKLFIYHDIQVHCQQWLVWVSSAMPAQWPSRGVLHSLWMWLVLILISGTLSSSTMWQMRTTQQPSSVLTVSISLRHTTPSLLTTSVLVMCTTSLSSLWMVLARERAVPALLDLLSTVSRVMTNDPHRSIKIHTHLSSNCMLCKTLGVYRPGILAMYCPKNVRVSYSTTEASTHILHSYFS